MSTLLEDRPIDDQTLARPMPTRPLGSFPWEVSVITLGGVKWDTQCSDSEAVALIQQCSFEAVLFPAGLFNMAYDYSFSDTVLPIARSRNMAVLGMKVMGAGRVRHAASVEPYLRYSLNQPIDTAVIGAETMEQLE